MGFMTLTITTLTIKTLRITTNSIMDLFTSFNRNDSIDTQHRHSA